MTKHILILSMLFLFAAMLCGCSDDKKSQLDEAIKLVEIKPDSALMVFNRINRFALSDREQARYALYYTMAQDKSGIDVLSDSLLRVAYDYFGHDVSSPYYTKANYYMGLCMSLNKNHEAEEYFSKAIASLGQTHDYVTGYKAYDLYGRSVASSNSVYAVELGRKALALQEEYDGTNRRNHVFLLLGIAQSYLYGSDEELSLPCLRQALSEAEAIGSKDVISFVCQDFSAAYLTLNEPDSALFYINKSISMDTVPAVSKRINLAVALLRADSLQSCQKELDALQSGELSVDAQVEVYRCLSDLHCKRGNFALALSCADSAYMKALIMYEDALYTRYEYQKSLLSKERDKLSYEGKLHAHSIRQKYMLVVFTIFIVALVFCFGVYRMAVRRKTNYIQALHEAELRTKEELLHKEIEAKELRCSIMRDYVKKNLEINRKLSLIQGHEKSVLINDAEWNEIETFLNDFDEKFAERISSAYPELSKKDVQFCMLLRLGIDSNYLQDIYCINERSIKQKKYHFKKKLGLENPNISLLQFIKSF